MRPAACDGFRLAEIEGAVDVDAFLNTVDPKLFARWRAWFRVKDAESWEMAATIAATAWNAAIFCSGASREAIKELIREPHSFIPPGKQVAPPEKISRGSLDDVDVEAFAAMLNRRFGAG